MGKYLDAVAVLTLIVIAPLVLSTAYSFGTGASTLTEYLGIWKEIALMLIGFWLRGVQNTKSDVEVR